MKHLAHFENALEEIRSEGRYRVFIDVKRYRGEFPKASVRHTDGREPVSLFTLREIRMREHAPGELRPRVGGQWDGVSHPRRIRLAVLCRRRLRGDGCRNRDDAAE